MVQERWGQIRLAIALVAILTVAASACDSTSQPRSNARARRIERLLSPGPLPRVPGPERHLPTIAVVGSSIVVLGGTDDADATRPVRGGWVLTPGHGWRALRGSRRALRAMVGIGTVSTGRYLLVVGTQCGAPLRDFDEEGDIDPCGGRPLSFARVDAARARVVLLPPPRLHVYRESRRYSHGIGWDGSRAFFAFDAFGGASSYDTDRRRWSRVPRLPASDGYVSCVSQRVLIGFDLGDASRGRPVRVWMLEHGSWRGAPTFQLPTKELSMASTRCSSGALFALSCEPSPVLVQLRQHARRWRPVPPIPGCGTNTVDRIGGSMYAAGARAIYRFSPRSDSWSEVPLPIGWRPSELLGVASQPYADRLLLLSVEVTGSQQQQQMVLLDPLAE